MKFIAITLMSFLMAGSVSNADFFEANSSTRKTCKYQNPFGSNGFCSNGHWLRHGGGRGGDHVGRGHHRCGKDRAEGGSGGGGSK